MSSIHGLPRHGGLPVPYVVPWSTEVKAAEFAPLKVTDGYGHRIDFHPEVPLAGQPLFASISTRRQTNAIINGLCQVCGEKIQEDYYWISHPYTFISTHDGDIITADPAVCSGCLSISLSLCPFLKGRDPKIVSLTSYDVWGVEAQITSPTTGKPEKLVAIPYEGKEQQEGIKIPNLMVIRVLAKIAVQEVPTSPLGEWNDIYEGYSYPKYNMEELG